MLQTNRPKQTAVAINYRKNAYFVVAANLIMANLYKEYTRAHNIQEFNSKYNKCATQYKMF